jgi:hypothetical protein
MLKQYQRLYGERQRVTGNTGQTAAMQRFGDEQRQANRHLAAMRAELRDAKEALHKVEQRQHRMEQLAEKAPKETGDAVGDAIDGAAARAGRHR